MDGCQRAGAKRQLSMASQSPELADLSQKALRIGTELERISGELDRLKIAKASKQDSRYAGLARRLEDLRLQLITLKTQADKPSRPAKTRADGKSGGGQDHRRAAQDAMQKMLDLIHSLELEVKGFGR